MIRVRNVAKATGAGAPRGSPARSGRSPARPAPPEDGHHQQGRQENRQRFLREFIRRQASPSGLPTCWLNIGMNAAENAPSREQRAGTCWACARRRRRRRPRVRADELRESAFRGRSRAMRLTKVRPPIVAQSTGRFIGLSCARQRRAASGLRTRAQALPVASPAPSPGRPGFLHRLRLRQ